jgi:hypothetical protein
MQFLDPWSNLLTLAPFILTVAGYLEQGLMVRDASKLRKNYFQSFRFKVKYTSFTFNLLLVKPKKRLEIMFPCKIFAPNQISGGNL